MITVHNFKTNLNILSVKLKIFIIEILFKQVRVFFASRRLIASHCVVYYMTSRPIAHPGKWPQNCLTKVIIAYLDFPFTYIDSINPANKILPPCLVRVKHRVLIKFFFWLYKNCWALKDSYCFKNFFSRYPLFKLCKNREN